MDTILVPKENTVEYQRFTIFVAYTKVYPSTLISLIGYNYQPVKTDDNYTYSEYFKDRWKEENTFINIEQDIVVYPGAIEALWDCPQEFCAYDFHLPNHRKRNLEEDTRSCPLGCIKISKEMIKKSFGLWNIPIPWNECDQRIIKSGIKVHQHYPSIVNTNIDLLGFVNLK